MFDPKIKIRKALHEKLTLAAEIRGVASIEELAEQLLEKSVDEILRTAGKAEVNSEDVEAIAQKLKGLGYLD